MIVAGTEPEFFYQDQNVHEQGSNLIVRGTKP